MNPFFTALKFNLSGQLVVRIVSFLINIYLARYVDPFLLGFLNVRMMLLYNTIGFLSREPIRKACLSLDAPLSECIKLVFLSPILFLSFGTICSAIWYYSQFPNDITLMTSYTTVIAVFSLSILIEGFAEPMLILDLKINSNSKFFVYSNALLVLLQRPLTFVLIILKFDPLISYCVSQIFGSVLFLTFHLWVFFTRTLTIVRQNYPTNWWSVKFDSLSLIGTLIVHSLLKQFITDGSAYVMTFIDIFSLKTQAVYDSVERLVGLIVRLILAPTEEYAAIYFSAQIPRNTTSNDNGQVPRQAIMTFLSIVRYISTFGAILLTFCVPYSRLIVWIYGGELLVENDGAKFLSVYAFYLVIMAVNGISECFAFASMNKSEIGSHGTFLLFAALIHLTLNIIFAWKFGPVGFILANAVNSLFRILYNWLHILKHLKASYEDPKNFSKWDLFTQLVPSSSLILLLAFTFPLTLLSYLIFGTTPGLIYIGAHIAIGGVMFLLVCAHLYNSELQTVPQQIDAYMKAKKFR